MHGHAATSTRCRHSYYVVGSRPVFIPFPTALLFTSFGFMFSSVARLLYTQKLSSSPTSLNDFHFCSILPGDSFPVSLERHIHYICGALSLKPGQKVLHIGSGTGHVAVEFARFADVSVVGVEPNFPKVQLVRYSYQSLLNHLMRLLDPIRQEESA